MKILIIFTLVLSLNLSCGNNKSVSRQENTQKEAKSVVQKDIKKKADNQIVNKYGFQFKMPANWQTALNDFETKNLKGEVKTVETVYEDNATGSRIRLVYHPGDSGMTLYRYYAKDIKSKKIKVGGKDAIRIDESLTRDGKGHLLSKPVIRHKIYMVSSGQKGVLEIVYDLPGNDDKSVKVYENFIKGITPVE